MCKDGGEENVEKRLKKGSKKKRKEVQPGARGE